MCGFHERFCKFPQRVPFGLCLKLAPALKAILGEAFFFLGGLFFVCLFAASWSCAWRRFLLFASVRFSLFAFACPTLLAFCLFLRLSLFAFFALIAFCFFALLMFLLFCASRLLLFVAFSFLLPASAFCLWACFLLMPCPKNPKAPKI